MKKILPDQIVVFWRKGKGMRSLSQYMYMYMRYVHVYALFNGIIAHKQ